MLKLVVIAAILSGLSACESIDQVALEAAFFQTNLNGDIAVGPSSGSGALDDRRNDLNGDLGVGEDNPALLLGGRLNSPIGRFGASGFWFDESGSGTLGADFGDIPIGAAVNSEFEFLNVKTWWAYDVFDGRDWRVSPGVAVDFFDLQTTVRSTASGGAFEQIEMFAPVPMLILDGEAQLGPVRLAAQGGGMRIDLGDGLGTYWDFEGRIGFRPVDEVEVFAGYRYLDIDSSGVASSRDAKVDMAIHGWFLGGEVRF